MRIILYKLKGRTDINAIINIIKLVAPIRFQGIIQINIGFCDRAAYHKRVALILCTFFQRRNTHIFDFILKKAFNSLCLVGRNGCGNTVLNFIEHKLNGYGASIGDFAVFYCSTAL